MISLKHHIYLLSTICIIHCSEPPLKKQKTDAALPLSSIIANHIAAKFHLYADKATQLPLEVRESFISPALSAYIKKNFSAPKTTNCKLTSLGTGCECYFMPDLHKIVSFYPLGNNKAKIYTVSSILENKIEENKNSLEPAPTCYNKKDKIYTLQQKWIDGNQYSIQRYSIQPNNTLRFNSRSILKFPIEGIPKKIMCENGSDIFIGTENLNESKYNLYLIHDNGLGFLISSNKGSAIHSVHSIDNGIHVIVYNNGKLELFDQKEKNIYDCSHHDLIHQAFRVITADVAPDKTTVAVGLDNKKIFIYNLISKTIKTLQIDPLYSLNALHFYNEEHLLIAKKENNKDLVHIDLYNIPNDAFIAITKQNEALGCNSLHLSPDKKYLALGMKCFDIGLQTMDSFDFNTDLIDSEKIYSDPQLFVDIIQKPTIHFAQKLELMRKYIKDSIKPSTNPVPETQDISNIEANTIQQNEILIEEQVEFAFFT